MSDAPSLITEDAGWGYADDVLSGKIIAGKKIQQACLRAVNDLKESKSSKNPLWEYDPGAANHFLTFSQQLAHYKGELAGQFFKPEPWQVFTFSQVYGWYSKTNQVERRFREVDKFVARKNGKTFECSGVALYDVLFGDAGAEVYSVATKADQAKIVWSDSAAISRNMEPRLGDRLSITVRDGIFCADRSSFFKYLGRVSKTLDGLNPSLVIIDEAGAIEDPNLFSVMKTGMGNRVNPLLWMITTAYFNKATTYYNKYRLGDLVLSGDVVDDRRLVLHYELDPEDDWKDPENWIKANPNLGVSVKPEFLEEQIRDAERMEMQREHTLTKHLNIWVSSHSTWLGTELWDNLPKGDESLKTGACYIAGDLAQTNDLTALCRVWEYEPSKYYAEFKFWLPRSAYDKAQNYVKPVYDAAINCGILEVTENLSTDYTSIEKMIRGSCEKYDVRAICFDPYNATHMVNSLEDSGLPVMMVRQNISNMSPASKLMEVVILDGRLAHTHNSFVSWQLNNCVKYTDVNENIKIRKGDDKAMKIDGIIALIMAIGAAEVNANKRKKPLQVRVIDLG